MSNVKAMGYPANWEEMANSVKADAGWRCERCGHAHDPEYGYMLTVHHLDGNKANSERVNLAALCQRCHLHVQNISISRLTHQLELFAPFERNWLGKHII